MRVLVGRVGGHQRWLRDQDGFPESLGRHSAVMLAQVEIRVLLDGFLEQVIVILEERWWTVTSCE